MNFFLEFRLNACPICLTCFDCQSEYGKECICQAREIEWKRKKAERDYTVNFCHKPLTQKGATNQKVTLDKGFVDWLFANVSPHIKFSLQTSCTNFRRAPHIEIALQTSYILIQFSLQTS